MCPLLLNSTNSFGDVDDRRVHGKDVGYGNLSLSTVQCLHRKVCLARNRRIVSTDQQPQDDLSGNFSLSIFLPLMLVPEYYTTVFETPLGSFHTLSSPFSAYSSIDIAMCAVLHVGCGAKDDER